MSILGVTGSVGRSTLDLVLREPKRFDVLALTAHRDVAGLAHAARATGARRAVIGDATMHTALVEALSGSTTQVASGDAAITEAAAMGADWTMAAIVGCAGLRSTMAAIAGAKTVAFANKESMVSAGALMMAAAAASGATLLPVDSEHNAIFQCLAGNSLASVKKITLTASGGPFRCLTLDQMCDVIPAMAVRHPNWSMGAKISVDSATMMNKGLELIEAHHLFALDSARIGVLVHPQSVVHSLVEYIDGSVLAQLGSPDMRIPIASTLAWPERMSSGAARLDLASISRLDFEMPDLIRFPALALARAALEAGGARPAVLNAANEVAVAAFLDGRLGFLDIARVVEAVLEHYLPVTPTTIDEVLAIDDEARGVAAATVKDLN